MVKQIPVAVFPAKQIHDPGTLEPLVDPQRRITPKWHRWCVMVDEAIRRFARYFTFLALEDTPDSYSGQANKVVTVKADESGLEFRTNAAGDVTGPTSATNNDFVQFDGNTGKLIKDGGLSLDTDGTLAANSDSNIPSQKAVKTYVTAAVAAGSGTSWLPVVDGAEPPSFLTDGAGSLITTSYSP